MARRSKHEGEMNQIRKSIDTAMQEHKATMEQLDKQLLDTRITIQKEAESKIKSMEAEAQDVRSLLSRKLQNIWQSILHRWSMKIVGWKPV